MVKHDISQMIVRRGDPHPLQLRVAGLQWLQAEHPYQRRKMVDEQAQWSLDNGFEDSRWAKKLGAYPVVAAMALQRQRRKSRLRALQAAGKTAAVGRALHATLIDLSQPDVTQEQAHKITFSALQSTFPTAESGFAYGTQAPQYPQLAEAMKALQDSLPYTVTPGNLPRQCVEHGRLICLAASQLYMDYLVQLCPPGWPIVLPRAGEELGVIRAWPVALQA